MSIIRINELPEASGVTSDDLFIIMDDPSGTAITKKIPASLIGGGGGGSITIANSGDNRILTSTGSGINAESNLTFNGTNLVVVGDASIDNIKIDGNTISSTSGNIIISPIGNGSLQRDSGGNARGQYATDWQKERASSTEVASGNYSVIGGGHNNTSNGTTSTVSGGRYNSSGGDSSVVGGGRYNNSSNFFSVISGGRSNNSNGYYSTVSAGSYNTASNLYSTIGGGYSNESIGLSTTIGGGTDNYSSGASSSIVGGTNNKTFGSYSSIPGGWFGITRKHGELSHAGGAFAVNGDAQHTILIARTSTSDNTANQRLYLDGSSALLTIPAKTAWTFNIKLSAYNDTDNQGGWWIFRGGIRRNAANGTSLIGSLISENGVESSLSTADANIVADDTNEALEIRVTGVNGKNIRWVAVVDLSQVSYGTP